MRRISYGLVFALLVLTGSSALRAEERMVLGPRQFEHDRSGAGAVLCVWSIYLAVRAISDACGWPRESVDDAFDEAIAEIDRFIVANSSLRPTPAMVEAFKRSAMQSTGGNITRGDRTAACQAQAESIGPFRKAGAEDVRQSVKALLATPREPVMNPCL